MAYQLTMGLLGRVFADIEAQKSFLFYLRDSAKVPAFRGAGNKPLTDMDTIARGSSLFTDPDEQDDLEVYCTAHAAGWYGAYRSTHPEVQAFETEVTAAGPARSHEPAPEAALGPEQTVVIPENSVTPSPGPSFAKRAGCVGALTLALAGFYGTSYYRSDDPKFKEFVKYSTATIAGVTALSASIAYFRKRH